MASPQLPHYCKELTDKIVKSTGYPVHIAPEDAMRVDSDVQVASKERPVHTIIYASTLEEHKDHLVVCGAYQIQRMWQLPPEKRYRKPRVDGSSLIEEYTTELSKKIGGYFRKASVETLAKDLTDSLVLQATHIPIDILVEHEVARGPPKYRVGQEAFLKRIIEYSIPRTETVSSILPEHYQRAVMAMRKAYAEEASTILGVTLDPTIKNHPSRKLADRLLSYVAEAKARGPPGEQEMIEGWQREAGVNGIPIDSIGNLLHTTRKEKNLSVSWVASQAGITANYLYQLESGKKLAPSYSVTVKLGKILGLRNLEIESLWQQTKQLDASNIEE